MQFAITGRTDTQRLADWVTMADVKYERERRRWPGDARQKLWDWAWGDAGASEDEKRVGIWMKHCRPQGDVAWGPSARAKLGAGLDSDAFCSSEWEQEARDVFAVLVSATKTKEHITKEHRAKESKTSVEEELEAEENAWTRRFRALDISSHIEEWKEWRAQDFKEVLSSRKEKHAETIGADVARFNVVIQWVCGWRSKGDGDPKSVELHGRHVRNVV